MKRIILTAIASLTIATTGHATDYIPDAGSDEEATAAFNWLQDQFGKPHASVHYDAATNTYNWIGPKFHKRMSIKRDAFDEQVWYPYWKKQRPTGEAPRAKLVATPTTIAGLTIATTGHAADYIPDAGSDEEATTAFNDLQDQFGKPNAKIVHYDSATDTYNWIGPKLHKRMSLKREEFNDRVWYPYWKSHHPPKAELVATPTPELTPELATPAATTTEASTPTEVASHSSGPVGGAIVGLIFLVAFIWGLFKVFPQIFSSFGSSTPSSPPVTNNDVARQLKILQVLLLSNQPGAEKAIEFLKNPRVDTLNISDGTGHLTDLKGENGEPWLIPYRCPQYMPRKGEIMLWGFDNVKYWHQGTHSEYHGGSAGVSFRVARGLWVRTGRHRGHSVSHQSMDYKGVGTLLLTNQGFAFIGTSTIRVLFQHIVSFEPYKDGVGFETEQVRNNKYLFSNMSSVGTSFVDDAINVLNGGSSRLIAALPAPAATTPAMPISTAPPLT